MTLRLPRTRPVLAACLMAAFSSAPFAQAAPARLPPRAAEANQHLSRIVEQLPAACQRSRQVLLGDRDPNGPSCVRFVPTGEMDKGVPPVAPGDANGGPGKRLLQRAYWEHDANSPLADYRWHRDVMVPFLGRLAGESNAAARVLPALMKDTFLLEASFALLPEGSWVTGLRPVKAAQEKAPTNWPLLCLHRLNEAIAKEDLAACDRWSAELGAALFAMEDLHRWLEFLTDNQLANLRVQPMCEGLFKESESAFGGEKEPYVIRSCVSRFPGGNTESTAFHNYLEVERQAEGLFRDPAPWARAAEESNAARSVPAAVWMPPDLREAFLTWRGALGEHNQKVLDRAASAPFERSFLANMLFRCRSAGTVEQVAKVLARFERRFPQAEVWQLMDVLPYRAGLGMSGLEWADRYDKRLMEMSARVEANTPREAFFEARRMQYQVYGGNKNYKNLVLTLRKALDTGNMDCIRATDMIGALYRNAGFPGFAYIRWCWGTNGHSVAVVEEPAGDAAATTRPGAAKSRLTIVDGLHPPSAAVGAWPEDYFTGHQDVYCAELFGRALDTCIFLEAYVIRGPNAGTLVKAPIPYLPGRDKAVTKKVFPASGPASALPPRQTDQ